MATSMQSVKLGPLGAGNTAPVALKGGRFAVVAVATGAGTIDLTILAGDGSTFVKTITTISATTGYAVVDLPPGQFRIEVGGFTNVFVTVTSVPT